MFTVGQDLNTLIDAAEALEVSAARVKPTNDRGGVSSPASAPIVNPFYSLTFFHRQPEHQQQQHPRDDSTTSSSTTNDSADISALVELRAELRFPSALSADPSGTLRRQLRRQLDGLLKRVSTNRRDVSGQGMGDQLPKEMLHGDGRDRRRATGESVKGGTEDDFYDEAFGEGGWGAPPRDGIRTERWVDAVGGMIGILPDS